MIFEDLKRCSDVFAKALDFNTPAQAFPPAFLRDYSGLRSSLESSLGYVWTQWLLGTQKEEIRRNVLFAVNRGLRAHGVVRDERMRGLHDLLLSVCALFVCTATELRSIASDLVEASGDESNDGELHYRAWSGAMRGLLLGDSAAAKQQYKQLEGSRCPLFARTGSRAFLLKAINNKWSDFAKLQREDFDRLWKRSRSDGTLRGDLSSPASTVVRLVGWPPQQLWCWTHAGLALLGHRKGADIETDELWLPKHALQCVNVDRM